ncbi:hypothetical protein D6855_06125 [Butyrivibrio sp. CB08]|uniref:TraX family protein n=1 Tax=Butyrivibrio sp. CB08 TaxID=2364879 RepID=UPI000EA9078F|nr:TraX family protein [Butyrivibrio sp. CB08]RKM61467.1 hypothetical protein D6855_06125 [Butyrivibrio sp. CB08]
MKKINGNTLKLIACITMFIDHATAGIMLPVVNAGLYPDSIPFDTLNIIYKILRGIGRNSFPIFCFLLVEGFVHTKSRLRYALSLLIFGFISEPFFDVCFYAKEDVFNINIFSVIEQNRDLLSKKCNVYFTLLIGLLVIWGVEKVMDLVKKHSGNILISYALAIVVAGAGIYVAEIMKTDYHGYGVFLIFVFYILRNFSPANLIGAYLSIISLGTEYLALPSFGILYFYNQKRGRSLGRLKYLFYAFYPVHIAFIILLRCLIYG